MSNRNFIHLGTHKIEASISTGCRMVNGEDLQGILGDTICGAFVDAKHITDALFEKIYKTNTATNEQKVIYDALCVVGIYSLIDEVCGVDLSKISYVNEFNMRIKD